MIKDKRIYLFLFTSFFLISFYALEIRTSAARDEGVILHDDVLFHPGPVGEVLDQALAESYPAWSSFRQQPDWYDEPVSAGQIIQDASFEETFQLNTSVTLVTVGLAFDWQLPEDGDLFSRARDTGEQLVLYSIEWSHPDNEQIRSQYPEVNNGASYALFAYFDFDEGKLQVWKDTYKKLFGSDPSLSADFSLQSRASDIQPFLSYPFVNPTDSFYAVNSFFDHKYPIYNEEDPDKNNLFRFDGESFSPANVAGVSWYSGHDGTDYNTPEGVPIYAAASGKVSRIDPSFGAVVIEHENGLASVYMHMDVGSITVEMGDEVARGQKLGEASDTGSEGQIHLHFGVRYQDNVHEDLDPFGWWDAESLDPWIDYPDWGRESAWLWRGDEAGDGYLTVDNRESQAQLFRHPYELSNWHRVERGYQGEAWYALQKTYYERFYWAIWGTYIPSPGKYQVQAYWPADPPDNDGDPTSAAKYEIYRRKNGELIVSEVVADQTSSANQWVTLGTYDFERGSAVVILSDVTDDSSQVNKRIYFDAIRWKEVPPTPTPTPTPTSTPTPTPTPTPSYPDIKIQVDQSNEDAGPNPSACQYSTSWNEIYFGQCDNGTLITSGFRFGNVPIPQGAQIVEAFIEFTTDGPYENIPVLVLINGEDSGHAQPFNSTDPPTSRPQTLAHATWDIPPSDRWELGDVRRSPDLSDILQEIVSRQDWSMNNGVAFIFNTKSSGTAQHRRVIGYDRPEWYPGTEHAARLYVTFEGPPPPTFTPTPTDPPPTPTPFPSPTPTQKPICPIEGLLDFLNTKSMSLSKAESPQITGTPTLETPTVLKSMTRAVDMAEFAPLLYRVRDEYLTQTEEGQRYIALFKEYMTEISLILFPDENLYKQGYDVIKAWEPNLRALVDGKGDQVAITEEQVNLVMTFLDALSKEASSELQDTIQAEQKRKPLAEFVGATMEQAWSHVNDRNVSPELTLSGQSSLKEGGSFRGSGSFVDPGSTRWTGLVDYGRGAGFQSLDIYPDQTILLNQVYPENGLFTVTVHIVDEQGAVGESTMQVMVENVAPKVTLHGDLSLDEGDIFTGKGSFEDPGADSWTVTVDYGDGSGPEKLVLKERSFSLEHQFQEDGVYQVQVCVLDDDGGEGCTELSLSVNNLPPIVDAGADQTSEVGQGVAFSGSFVDPGALDTHTITWDFGDEETSEGTLTPTHTYRQPGTFTVTLTVTDDEGAAASDSLIVKVNQPPPLRKIVLSDRWDADCLSLNLDNGDYTWYTEDGTVYSGKVEIIKRNQMILFRSSWRGGQYLQGYLFLEREFGAARLRVGRWFGRDWFFVIDMDYMKPQTCK